MLRKMKYYVIDKLNNNTDNPLLYYKETISGRKAINSYYKDKGLDSIPKRTNKIESRFIVYNFDTKRCSYYI